LPEISYIQYPLMRWLATLSLIFCSVAAHAEIRGAATVMDGDTIKVASERIRLHAIDAPELRQTCTDDRGEYPCGRRAAEALRAEVAGAEVVCNERGRDRYRRTVAVCRANGHDIGRDMVRLGWALAYRRYGRDYVPAEDEARRNRAGLWQGQFVEPWNWRAERRRVPRHRVTLPPV
jgi:endonuclease YncB( thermonuclease family)